MADRILIQGGIVLTQDPELGELPAADVLIEGDTIAAIGDGLDPGDVPSWTVVDEVVIRDPGGRQTSRPKQHGPKKTKN